MTTRNVLAAALVVAFVSASPVSAQNATAEADAAFDKGKKLMTANKFAEACTAFEDSQRLSPAATTQMNLANCREKNEQLVTAHVVFSQVAKDLEGDKSQSKLREVALSRAANLAPRLSKLTLVVPQASQVSGLEIQLDERPLPASQWNQGIPLDGGMYKLIARAADRTEWTTTIAIAPAGDTKTIEVPTLRPANASAPDAPPARAAARTASNSNGPIILGIAAVGLGGVALGFELWGRSIYSDAEAADADRDEQVRLWDKANSRHYVAQAAGIAAIGCAGAAIIWYVTRDKTETPPAVSITPVTTSTTIGLAFDGRF